MNFTWKLVRHESAADGSIGLLPGIKAPDPDISQFDPIVHNSQLHLHICRTHRHAVENLVVHLRSYHSELSLNERRRIVHQHQRDVVVKLRETKLPSVPIAPIAELKPPVFAQRCTWSECTFTCASIKQMRQHAGRQHQWSRRDRRPQPWEPIFAQTLAVPGLSGVYFRVHRPRESNTGSTAGLNNEEVVDECDQDIDQEDADEVRRLLLFPDDTPALDNEVDYDHESDWLRACQWPQWFKGKSLVVITSATVAPAVFPTTDYVLGQWHTLSCVSPVEDEQCLRRIVTATHKVLERCEATAQETPRLFRCWLRSWGPSFLPVPFNLLKRESSRQRYHSYWRKFVCYVFRVYRLCHQLKERTRDIFGVEFSTLQQQTIQYLWHEFSQLDDSIKTTSPDETIPAHLLEQLFQFFVILWTENTLSSAQEHNPIVHFSGVLGIHPHDLFYRRAYDYTPYLAALIWLGRLMLLEYALPVHAYQHLPHIWPARTAYPDQLARLREDIRPRFLQRGSPSPVGYLIERLQHGRAIARRDGCKAQIAWSADDQLLRVNNHEIWMSQFRAIVHGAIVRAHQQTQDLLFGWWPEFDLAKVDDDLTCTRPGFSFLQDPANQLQYGFRVLKQRAFHDTKSLRWHHQGQKTVLRYLKACDRLVDLLYGSVHLTSGMPPRCEELRTILWANTPTSLRNVFVHQGQIILVFSYNKAVTHHNNSFYIVRTPCPMVQKLLFVYLAYIRPFRDHLQHQLRKTASIPSNPHVFTTYQEATTCFSAARCLRSLQLSTVDAPFLLSTAIYRQIAVSIAKKHLPRLVRPFDPSIPQDQTGILRLLAFQTGHRPQTQAHHYAIDQAYPSRLQPDLIERYDANSRLWHEFNLIRAEDVVHADVDNEGCQLFQPPTLPGYAAAKHPAELDLEMHAVPAGDEEMSGHDSATSADPVEVSSDDSEDSQPVIARRRTRPSSRPVQSPPQSDRPVARGARRTQVPRVVLSRPSKRRRDGPTESPESKRIRSMQLELATMLQARQDRRR